MKKLFNISILLIIVICALNLNLTIIAKDAADTFILFIEAEDCEMGGYTVVAGNKGAVGKMITCDTANEQTFTVNFTVPHDGQYTVWFKVWHTSQSDNSVLYDLNGVENVFDFDENAGADDPDYFMLKRWYWMEINMRGTEPLENGWSAWGEANNQCRHTPIKLMLKAGANSMTFKAREVGHFIDQIIITDDLDYNPADVPGNETYICTFCNLRHFKYEPYADFGKTPEQYWNERLAAETVVYEVTPDDAGQSAAEPSAAVTTAVVTAAQTSDIAWIAFMLLPAAVLITMKLKNRKYEI